MTNKKYTYITKRMKSVNKEDPYVTGSEDIDAGNGQSQQLKNIEIDNNLIQLSNEIDAVNKQDIIPVDTLPSVASADPKKIYRVVGEDSYTDYMVNASGDDWKKLSKFEFPGIDNTPTSGSDNLVKSGGIGEIFESKGITELSFNIVGGINGSDGSDSSNADFVRTGYIPVSQGMKITYDVQEGSSGWCAIACYDSNDDYVSEASVKGTSSGLFIIPNGVAKIRLSSLVDYTNTYAKFQFVSEYTEDYPNVITSKITDKAVTYPKLGNDVNAYLNRLLDISFIGGVGYNDGSISTQAATNHKMTWFVKVLEGEKINYDLLGGSTGWAVIATYNSSFEYIKASSIKGDASETTPSKGQYVVPSGVAYIIFSGMVGYDNSISFDTFEKERVVNVADERISVFDGYLLFKNIGGINANDGSDSTNPDFVKTDLIKVLDGDIINANIQEGSSGWCAIACYDSQKTFMADKSILGTGQVQNIQMIVPSGVSYIKLSSMVAYTERNATKNIVIRENVLDREIKEFDGYLDFKNIGGINADGTDSPNNEFKRTDLISVNTGDIIKASVQEGSSGWCAIACYDSSQVFVSDETILGTGQVQNILKTIPDGVSYIKISTMISYSGGYAIKNRVVRENELKTDTELTRMNTVSVMKYPNILQQRGCIAIQMDLSYLDNARSGCDSMLEVMREYGLMSMDYAINITALQDAEIDKLLGRQKEGCEIIYHNRINSPSDFSNNSTLTVAELKEGVLDERLAMTQKGFTTFGVVANVGSLATRYKPTIDNIFFWSEYGSKEILTEGAENTKTQYLSDHRIIRTAFDMEHSQHTPALEAEMIAKGKAWIDDLCTNKTMGVMYCHFYDRTTDVYHLYEGVLRAMCEYIAEKISDGKLWYGRTTECLNYLCR